MISITPVILPHHKNDDDTYNIKIRVTYKRRSKYLATAITAYPSDYNKKTLALKPGNAMTQASGVVKEINDIIGSVSYSQMCAMEVDDIVELIKERTDKKEPWRLDFIQFARSFIATKCAGTQSAYTTSLNALIRFAGEELDISKINLKFIKDYEKFLRSEAFQMSRCRFKNKKRRTLASQKNPNTVRLYISNFRIFFRAAMMEFNNPDTNDIKIPINPFDYYKEIHPKATTHRNVSIDCIQEMINTRNSLLEPRRKAIDYFLMSFCMFGINLADMWTCAQETDGVLVYYRQKTRERRLDRAEMHVRIEPCIRNIVDRYKSKSKTHMFKSSECEASLYKLNCTINYHLAKWCKEYGFDKCTFYSARHSWATIASSSAVGGDKRTVNDCLIHIDKDMEVTDVYIEKDWKVFWELNEKVLSLFDWSPIM